MVVELKITPQRSSSGPSCQKWAAGIAGYIVAQLPLCTPHLKPDVSEPKPSFHSSMSCFINSYLTLLHGVGNIVLGVHVPQIPSVPDDSKSPLPSSDDYDHDHGAGTRGRSTRISVVRTARPAKTWTLSTTQSQRMLDV
jgi:hypothetical protein